MQFRQLLLVSAILLLTPLGAMAAGTKRTATQKNPPLAPIPLPTITASQQGPTATSQPDKAPPVKPPPLPPPAVLSIIPAQGEPGINVILSGSGFTDSTTAWLGTSEIQTRLLGPEQLSFELPQLAPGLYALFLKSKAGQTSKTYSFTILPRKPVAQALSPEVITACAQERDREVMIRGRNFTEESSVLFDGAAVRSRFISAEAVSFLAPPVAGGLHTVQVRNNDETLSAPLALMIDSRPEISSVTTGNEAVNYYELSLHGKNFQQGSTVIVDGRRIGSGLANPGDRDRVIYMNCNHLIYQRYPYDTSAKELRLQVVNGSGEQSSAVTVTAP
jgi:hypothetical protein